MGHRLQGAVAARPSAWRGHGGLAVPLEQVAPYYDEIETLIGVQGDVASIPAFVQRHQPQQRPYPMPPGAQMRSSTLLAADAKRLGLHPFYFPMAANSVEYNGSPACNNCGFCSGYGCPISAKLGNLMILRRALRTGRTQLRPQTTVTQVNYTGRRATGVSFIDAAGNAGGESADFVLACSAVLSPRLGAAVQPSRPLCPHRQTDYVSKLLRRLRHLPQPASARLPRSLVHAGGVRLQRSRLPRTRVFARLAGLPYIRAGLCELGGSQNPIAEGKFYQEILGLIPGVQFFGRPFKELMRSSLLRDRLAGVDCFATDMPYLTNNVTLDPTIKDLNGQPDAPGHLQDRKVPQGLARLFHPFAFHDVRGIRSTAVRRGTAEHRQFHRRHRATDRPAHHGRDARWA